MCQLIGQALILGYLSEYFAISDPTPTETRNAYIYAAVLAVLSFTLVTSNGLVSYMGHKGGMLVRILATGAVYDKVNYCCVLVIYCVYRCSL